MTANCSQKQERISVIVPAYNEARYIRHCLDSLLNQNYENLEIIVVDDGSSDETPEIIQTVADLDDRIVMLRQDNAGLSAARNTGLDRASGEFIAFVDSNDVVAPNHFTGLWNLMNSQRADVAITNLTLFAGSDLEFFDSFADFDEATTYSVSGAISELFYQGSFDTCAPGKLYLRELWNGVRFPVGYIHEDLPTVYRALLNAKRIAFAASASYGYRYSRDGLNHSRTTDAKARVVTLLDEQLADLLSDMPQLTNAAHCFLVSLCFHLYLGGDRHSLSPSCSNHLKHVIRQFRAGILRDGRARGKTRAACALSYLGFPTVRVLFSLGRRLTSR